MYTALTTLVDQLDKMNTAQVNIIKWGCPIPLFGDITRSSIATIGLNPSNKEFVDNLGRELRGADRRFPTLSSLKLKKWADADASHLKVIVTACEKYFSNNPYDIWFKKLDGVISGTQASFYNPENSACHLDLIPYATKGKWTTLSSEQKNILIHTSRSTLGLLVRDSPISVIILNGRSVVKYFEEIAEVTLESEVMLDWSLKRVGMNHVKGIAYSGWIRNISGVDLGRDILILGYNHNIQSSFGVTTGIINKIQAWTSKKARSLL